MRFAVMVALCLAALVPVETCAQTPALSLADVLARAREQAPEIVSARLALDEVRARLAGASLRLQDNPEIDAAFSRRQVDNDGSIDLQLGVSQRFEPRARRAARVAGVNAEIERPLAIVMIGGLVTSTIFTLFVLPTFYLQVHGWLERRSLRHAAEPADA